ncbi:hypothetical protein ES703_46915 [subsurface metagenome]
MGSGEYIGASVRLLHKRGSHALAWYQYLVVPDPGSLPEYHKILCPAPSVPGAAFACVVCKVQGWESAGLRVMIYIPAGVVFPLGCPEVSPGDPCPEISPIWIKKTGCNASVRSDTEGFKGGSRRSEAFSLDLQTFEARISLRIDKLALVGAKVCGKRGVPGVRCLVGCEVGLLQGA